MFINENIDRLFWVISVPKFTNNAVHKTSKIRGDAIVKLTIFITIERQQQQHHTT
jgi:hypothetical protein